MNALSRLALASSLSLAACSPSDSGSGPQPPEFTCPIVAAPAAPTFAKDIGPALVQSCGSASVQCHGAPFGGDTAKGKIDFSNDAGRTAANVYAALVNKTPANAPAGYVLVKPGDPAGSWLVVKLSENDPGGVGQAYGNRMPLQLPNLCATTMDALTSWISQGAPP
ncbi:MAG: hypothetical protein U0229_07020 [Anaeromyxobacter sp.]